MPIQTLMRNGRKMYRWGDHGKVYPTKEQAEAQARAAYANGYKEPPKKGKSK